MTSKEALEELYKEREYLLGEKVNNKTKNWHNDITHYDNINHCLLTIKQDFDRLEELEKVVDLLWHKNVNIVYIKIFKDFKKYSEYYTGYSSKDKLTNEEFDLLKEVLRDGI